MKRIKVTQRNGEFFIEEEKSGSFKSWLGFILLIVFLWIGASKGWLVKIKTYCDSVEVADTCQVVDNIVSSIY